MRTGIPKSRASLAGLGMAALLIVWLTTPSLSADGPAPDLGLIEVASLEADRAAWVILDARPAKVYLEGHIPGARSFSWEDYTRTDERGVPFKILRPEEMAAGLSRLGIDETTRVVVYGDADKSWGGEGWACWALAWTGHRGPIRLLDGGIQAWEAGGGLTDSNAPAAPESKTYHAAPRTDLIIETADLRRDLKDVTVIDVRANTEWILGHISGAVHIPWDRFQSGDDRRPLPKAELEQLLRKERVRPDRPVVYVCAGGIRSAWCWLVHELAGLSPARNYEGGMEEWKRIK